MRFDTYRTRTDTFYRKIYTENTINYETEKKKIWKGLVYTLVHLELESVNAKLSIKRSVMSIHSILSHDKLILPMTWLSSLFPKIGIYAAK